MEDVLGSLATPGELGRGLTAFTGILLILSLSRCSIRDLSGDWTTWCSGGASGLPAIPLVGGGETELSYVDILKILSGKCTPLSLCSARRLRLLDFSALGEYVLWTSFRILTSGTPLDTDTEMSGGEGSVRQGWELPLVEPGTLVATAVAGSISFCQFLRSFLARLARSSSLVFFLTSLISFPSRVSYINKVGDSQKQVKQNRILLEDEL